MRSIPSKFGVSGSCHFGDRYSTCKRDLRTRGHMREGGEFKLKVRERAGEGTAGLHKVWEREQSG